MLVKIIENKLKDKFIINDIKIEDKSFLHKKHKNFVKNKYHLKLKIESPELKKIKSLEANRKIYRVLENEINDDIHSLQITIV